ncbi:TPA: two pore domain potassium channel family protein, partial [Legionella pneumophila]|nr:two pore domain potassium channel family protein [Legionella pneumophila]HCX3404699.1 two pore domain potassium channel family protein [Legionella pneumophila]HEL8473050.1 two pore domain potassium channel family protein [Legionella pneumophila]
PHPAFFSDALYFSFVTLGTLGYGDLVPVFGPIKMIASLEAIIGQLYIAILIARLVSVRRSDTPNQQDENDK